MKNLLKKVSLPSYLSCASVLTSLLALLFVLIASSGAYPIAHMAIVIVLSVLAIVTSLFAIFADIKELPTLFHDLATWVAILALSLALAITISGRSELMGFVWFSDLMSGNAVAKSALNLALVGWIFYLLSLVLLIVSSGFASRKETEAKKN